MKGYALRNPSDGGGFAPAGAESVSILWSEEATQPLLKHLFPELRPSEAALFEGTTFPWEAIARLEQTLTRLVPPGVSVAKDAQVEGAVIRCGRIIVSEGVEVDPGVVIVGGPVYLAPGAKVRAGAYIRGAAYIGEGAILGHASEVKNGILLAEAKAPHFNYVGDSILGHDVNLGAGCILSNFRLDGRSVKVTWRGERVQTGMRKLGALIGDRCSIGCNVVCNPGSILYAGVHVPPVTTVTGTLESAGTHK